MGSCTTSARTFDSWWKDTTFSTDFLFAETEKKQYRQHYMYILVKHRSAFAKFRCGVVPIRLDNERYEHLNVDERVCAICNTVESEEHNKLCLQYVMPTQFV